MTHDDHVNLLRGGVAELGGVWADLGSGSGAFTLALADLLGAGARIYSVDKDRGALREQERAMRAHFPDTVVEYVVGDFTRKLDLPMLDGVVMANSIHFVRDKEAVLRMVGGYLRPGGRLVLVEYNADKGNMWVPHPVSYASWEAMAGRTGFYGTRLVARVPSRFLKEIYSAVSLVELTISQT